MMLLMLIIYKVNRLILLTKKINKKSNTNNILKINNMKINMQINYNLYIKYLL